MPFLKTFIDTANYKHVDLDIHTPPEEPQAYDPTGDLKSGFKPGSWVPVPMTGLDANQKGKRYEDYIASLYSDKGYEVKNTGGPNDGGCDLICIHGRYTVLVQCKYRDPVPDASLNSAGDVFKLQGFMTHYALTHRKEIISGAFWTSLKDKQCKNAHDAARDLGIFFYEGVLVYKKSAPSESE